MTRSISLLLFLTSMLSLPTAVLAANHTVFATAQNTFSPAALTIQAGDSVTWTNQGGTHNVRADDGSFRCAVTCDDGGDGSPSAALWSFTLVFDTPGTIDYDCEFHFGLGMVGQVIVEANGGGDAPGSLRFANGAQSVAEEAGAAQVTVERIGGDDGAVSVGYSATSGSATAGADFSEVSGTLSWADNDDDPKSFSVPILSDGVDEADETVNLMLSTPTGGATLGSPSTSTLTIVDDDQATADPGSLSFTQTTVEGPEGASIQVGLQRTGGTDGAVGVRVATSDGSAEAGVDYEERSAQVTWADGDSATKTFAVATLDDLLEESVETINLSLSDPTGGAALGAPSTSSILITDDDTPSDGSCVPDETTLCLGRDGRFRVRVAWRTDTGEGNGFAIDIGKRDSGLFYFFGENNIEVLLKVLDACVPALGERYWVFLAATTTIEFDVEVLDTQTSRVRHYLNALGNAAVPVTDTDAFPCD